MEELHSKKPSDGVYSASLHAILFSNDRDEVTGARFCRVWGSRWQERWNTDVLQDPRQWTIFSQLEARLIVQDRSGAGHSATIGGVSDHSKPLPSVGENYWQLFRECPGMGAQGA